MPDKDLGVYQTPMPTFNKILSTPTMAQRRARALRAADETSHTPPEVLSKFGWILDAARRRRREFTRVGTNAMLGNIVEKVTANAKKGKRKYPLRIVLDNKLMLELVDLSYSSKQSIQAIVSGFLATGIQSLYENLDEAQTTLQEMAKSDATAGDLAKLAARNSTGRRKRKPAPPRKKNAARSKATRNFPTA